jgi:hypothetical protein
MLLSSQLQGFCRDLHSECVDCILGTIPPSILHGLLRDQLTLARRLNRGNPNAGNIGADFARLGLAFWKKVGEHDARNAVRQAKLHELNSWRNAIAHQDFGSSALKHWPSHLTLLWRTSSR